MDFYKVYVYMILFIEAPICALFIVTIFKKNTEFNENNFFKFLFNLACIQLCFVGLSIMFPGFRDLILITSREADSLVSISNDYGGLRSFGLASGYTSDLGMILGIFSMFCLIISLKGKRFSIVLFILSIAFAVGAAINARVGLFAPIFTVILLCLLFIFNLLSVVRFFVICAALFLSFIILSGFISFHSIVENFGRLFDMLDEVLSLISGNRVGTFKTLELMHFFPKDPMHFWFGTGKNVFNNDKGFGSDIGYVNDIFQIGLINLIVVMSMYIKLNYKSYTLLYERYGFVALVCLFVSFFIFYFKGVGLASNAISNYLVLISVGMYSLKKR
ncbi:hypothetical protein [Shewanella glacialipiscicola]|uniref:hypothetical protein n=1 Tax=Shewanella glacialipiscicola TaxID=614069 RepID=UPI003D7A8AFC